MSNPRLPTFLLALGLVTSGVVLLLFTLDALGSYQPAAQLILSVALAIASISFFVAYVTARTNWWRLIPAWTLLALGGMVFSTPAVNLAGTRPAALLFGGLALAFTHIYLLNRTEHWWAIMPGGFMWVLSLVIFLSAWLESLNILGALLFMGMGLVFGLVYLLGDRYRQWWAVLPGTILVAFGLFVLFAANVGPTAFARWWPVLLILSGLWIGWRGARPPARDRLEVHTTPARRPSLTSPQPSSAKGNTGTLGDYTRPAPGASVEVLPDDR